MKISRQVGTTNENLNIFVRDATNASSAGLANIVASSVNFGWCRNDQAALSSGTCSTSTGTLGTFTVSAFTQVNSTSSLGWYQFGVPNGIFASGRSALLHLYGAPNMAPVPIEIELTKFDNQAYVSTGTVLLDPTYGPAGAISTNIVQVAGTAVTGTGAAGNRWGP